MFLTNQVSPRYDSEKILGRWDFDANGALSLWRRGKVNANPAQIATMRNYFSANFKNARLIATPEQDAIMKSVPSLKPSNAAAAQLGTVSGRWKNTDGKYELSFNDADWKSDQSTVEVQSDRLVITGLAVPLVFIREN
jgi:hypothetical protein